jgi:type II secretory pathway pseudopilin PulG
MPPSGLLEEKWIVLISAIIKSKRLLILVEMLIPLFVFCAISATVIPYIKGRSNASKWAEGKAVAGSIRTAADAYKKEKGDEFNFSGTRFENLGFKINLNSGGGTFDGKYFTDDSYSIKFSKNGDYLITVDAAKSLSGDTPSYPGIITLDQDGLFTEIP